MFNHRGVVTAGLATAFIAIVYGCGGGVGGPPDYLGFGNDKATSNTDKPGSSGENPGAGETPTGPGGCSCPVGRWKCGNISFSITSTNGKCLVDPCTGAFAIQVEGTQVSGTFKNQQLCLNGSSCVACVPDNGTSDDGGVPDGGGNDAGPKDGAPDAPKDVSVDAKVCVPTCEIDNDCQSSCQSIPNAIACCDQNSFNCTYQAGSTCQ
jgi:hypothetical protein